MRYRIDHWDEAGADPGVSVGGGNVSVSLGTGGDIAYQTALSALNPEQQAAYGRLSGDVQNTIHQGMQVYGQVAPALAIARTIGAGGVPNEGEIVAGLAGVATLVGGPIVGAAVGAMGAAVLSFGEMLKGLFQAFGLYELTPKFDFLGLIRKGVDVTPYGPTDPNWIHIESPYDLEEFIFNGLPNHPPLNKEDGWDARMVTLFQTTLLQAIPDEHARCGYINGYWSSGHWHPGAGTGGTCNGSYFPQPFDSFVAILLKRNLQNWANAQPFISPRDLLHNAIRAWNRVHSGWCTENAPCPAAGTISTTCYKPAPPYSSGSNAGHSIVSLILGPDGDWPNYQNDAPPLCVNVGPPWKRIKLLAVGSPDKFAAMAKARVASTPSLATMAVYGAAGLAAVALLKPAWLAKIGLKL